MAAAEKKTNEIEEEEAPAKKSKLVPMLLGVNTLLVTGVLAFTLLRKPPAPAGEAAAHAEPAHGEEAKPEEHGEKGEGAGPKPNAVGPTVALENFIVQLRAVEAEKYAHITMEIELGDEKDKEVVGNYMPRIRDLIIGYLADRTADELRGSEGMTNVKTEVLHRLQEVVPGRRIRSVYVTSFIVQ
ncbi:MAG: flagellar basal body-associated FliL family protein [Deltaproteobacteria bacterium]|nr:flagellar basal body-associated FliL family protein [Deltaproteobacteria bacterium]